MPSVTARSSVLALAHALALLSFSPAADALRLPLQPSRRDALRAGLAATVLPALPALAAAPGKYQSDDKSWDVTLPDGWTLSPEPVRAGPGSAHVFRLGATRAGGGGLEVVVDKAPGVKSLAGLGSLEAVAERLRSEQPQPARLLESATVAGAVKGSTYYAFRFSAPGGGERQVKLAAYQDRLYRLTLDSAAGAEADEIVRSFTAWPVNIFCLSQSNNGAVPASGSCY